MATVNPRVAAYPPPRVYERLVEFKRSSGLKSDSAAIVAILEAYLFGSTASMLPSEPSSREKRIEDLEVKVSSLLLDVAVLKQAMSQYTRLSSGELLVDNSDLHQSDNWEPLSEPLNKSPNTSLDLRNEFLITLANTSKNESQINSGDGDTQLVKSSVGEIVPADSELLSESLLARSTDESSKYPLVQEGTPGNSDTLSELPKTAPNFVEMPEILEKGLGDTLIAIDESLASFNQLVAPQTSTCEAKEFSVEFSSSELYSEPTRVDIIQNSDDTKNITNELPKSDGLENPPSELPDASLGELSLVAENHHSLPSVNSEPFCDLPSSSLARDESKNSLQVPLHLTGAALARRLNVSPSTLRHKKNARNFGQWTSLHDPDDIAWYFDGQKFVSQERNS